MKYQRYWNGTDVFYEHRRIYEQHFGSIPEGFHVHHKNEDTLDNRPENLEILSPRDHRRLHSKSYRRSETGEWLKMCRTCGVWKPLSEFYALINADGYRSHRASCKPCQHDFVSAYMRQKRRLKTAAPAA